MNLRSALLLAGAGVLMIATACATPALTESTPSSAPETTAPLVSPEEFAEKIHWLLSTNSIGHNTVQIQTGDLVIYLDPVALVNVDQLPKADIIVVTHDHADHMSLPDILALSKPETKIVVPNSPSIARSFRDAVVLSAGESVAIEGVTITGVPAYNEYHPLDLGYLGYIIEAEGVRVYCSGDTGLTPEMLALTDIDIAVLNYYAPYVLSPEHVVEFAKTVLPRIIIPVHWKPEDANRPEAASLAELPAELPDSVRLLILPLE